jgi:hypothetical protein
MSKNKRIRIRGEFRYSRVAEWTGDVPTSFRSLARTETNMAQITEKSTAISRENFARRSRHCPCLEFRLQPAAVETHRNRVNAELRTRRPLALRTVSGCAHREVGEEQTADGRGKYCDANCANFHEWERLFGSGIPTEFNHQAQR